MANTVNFKIQLEVDGQQRVVNATADIGNLKKELGAAEKAASRFSNAFADLANVSMALDGVTNTIGQMQRGLQELTNAYAVQEQNEKRLETVMRERMDASAADIQQMKELASAQQAVGVIGDEVQLAGMQQVSTFLHEKEALEELVPAMNNLIAQQNGLNATQQDAQSIGNLLGKAMQGQTEALQRVGISFSEAQKKVMQTGTEMERASMLAEIITQNVGNMNEELRNTPTGEMKALENTIGDIKERVGELVQGIMPYLTIGANLTMAASGALKLATAVKSLGVAQVLAAGGAIAHNLQLKLLTAMMRQGIATATGLRIALQALKVASIIGIAIAALTEAVIYFTGKSEEAADAAGDLSRSTEALKESEDAYKQAAANARVDMDEEIRKLGELIKGKGDAKAAVDGLNRKYGDVFGSHKTAAAWYDVLTKKSQAYCEQLGYEAQMKALAAEGAKLDIDLQRNFDQRRDLWKNGGAQELISTELGGQKHYGDSKELKDLRKEGARIIAQQKEIAKRQEIVNQRLDEGRKKLGADVSVPTVTPVATNPKGANRANGNDETLKAGAKSYSDLAHNIGIWKKQLDAADPSNETLTQGLIRQIAAAEEAQEKIRAYQEEQKRLLNMEGLKPASQPGTGIDLTGFASESALKGMGKDIEEAGKQIGTLGQIESMLERLRTLRQDMTGEDLKNANKRIKALEEEADSLREYGVLVASTAEAHDTLGDVSKVVGALQGLGQSMNGLAGDSKALGAAMAGLSMAAAVAQLVATMTKKLSESFTIWDFIAGTIAGTAAVVSAASQLKGIAFANGGIVSGPTLGLIGEYAGARSNPEVVAPLDKLRSMIGPSQVSLPPGSIVGKVQGNDILLVASHSSNLKKKSGRRYGLG
ncbi:MAG: hypothetical protein IJ544_02740 [Prevotella sp.]|nr:hypothetical protein [Prevotella sp.]